MVGVLKFSGTVAMGIGIVISQASNTFTTPKTGKLMNIRICGENPKK